MCFIEGHYVGRGASIVQGPLDVYSVSGSSQTNTGAIEESTTLS